MQSIFNSGIPHIGEKILKCMDFKSIVSLHSANPELRSQMENYTIDQLDLCQKMKSYHSEIKFRIKCCPGYQKVNCQLFVYIAIRPTNRPP